MNPEDLLAQINDLLRTKPSQNTIHEISDENMSWLGRARAILNQFDSAIGITIGPALKGIQSGNTYRINNGYQELMTEIHRARHDLMMKTTGPLSAVIPSAMVFDYFDEIRKIIELAEHDVLFVDPYLDADFVSRYLPHIPSSARIRLLTSDNKLKTLIPAVEEFIKQNESNIELRSANGFHDRYVFVDDSCYQSGASFKDGGKNAPTTITQITDAYSAMRDTYEGLWGAAQDAL